MQLFFKFELCVNITKLVVIVKQVVGRALNLTLLRGRYLSRHAKLTFLGGQNLCPNSQKTQYNSGWTEKYL